MGLYLHPRLGESDDVLEHRGEAGGQKYLEYKKTIDIIVVCVISFSLPISVLL